MVRPSTLFVSYADDDRALVEVFEKHLALLERQGLVAVWHKRKAQLGEDWRREVHAQLQSAAIIGLIVTSDFLASRAGEEEEVAQALDRQKRGQSLVIPILARPADWRSAQFGHLQALPRNGIPICQWKSRDAAWRHCVEEIRNRLDPLPTDMQLAAPNSSDAVTTNEADSPVNRTVLTVAPRKSGRRNLGSVQAGCKGAAAEDTSTRPVTKKSVQRTQGTSTRYAVVLTATFNETDKAVLEAILTHLKNLSGDAQLTLIEIKPGSVVLIIEGSRAGFEMLKLLFSKKQLTSINGIPIQSVKLIRGTIQKHPRTQQRSLAMRGTITKADIIEHVYERVSGLSKKDAAAAVETVFDILKRAWVGGEKIRIAGFGKLFTQPEKARARRNTRMDEESALAARQEFSFRPSPAINVRKVRSW